MTQFILIPHSIDKCPIACYDSRALTGSLVTHKFPNLEYMLKPEAKGRLLKFGQFNYYPNLSPFTSDLKNRIKSDCSSKRLRLCIVVPLSTLTS